MQGDKSAVSSVMEAAANVAASAKSGFDKTKAVVEEKVERMSTSDEVEKDMASLRKEEKIDLAELRKCKAYAQNAVAAASPGGPNSPSFTDGSNFSTIGSFDTPATITSTNTADHSSPVATATDNFVVEDVGSHCPAIGSEMGALGSDNAPDAKTDAVDSNPTHSGMPAPVIQPSNGGVAPGSVYSSDTNTGAGTPIGTN